MLYILNEYHDIFGKVAGVITHYFDTNMNTLSAELVFV